MAISIRNVSKRFGSTTALDDVTLDVPRGSLTALLGPSGGGKSTLLRVVAGLEVPDAGTVEVNGRDMTNVPVRERGVGFCFQHYAPFRHLTVRRNVAFGLEVRKLPKPQIKERVDGLLELVKIAHVADRYPSQLSGGQRQRMALARALAIEPRVLLLDEPFGALDAQVRQQLRVWLRELHEKLSVTTLLVTHDQEEAMEIADRLAIINDGRLEQVGTPADLYDAPANAFVLGFLGPATYLDGEPVRPHDLVLHELSDPPANGRRARVQRVTHLGFEVRVDVRFESGDEAWAQLSRGQARELGVEAGDEVWVSRMPAHTRLSGTDGQDAGQRDRPRLRLDSGRGPTDRTRDLRGLTEETPA
jgi:sulfate/thiosulfate transport system ATP-binding protein